MLYREEVHLFEGGLSSRIGFSPNEQNDMDPLPSSRWTLVRGLRFCETVDAAAARISTGEYFRFCLNPK